MACIRPLLFGLAASALCQAGDFVRVDRTATATRLQTAVASYQKGDVIIDLIGAIHVADEAYYAALNEHFRTYEIVLFEMIGGEHLGGRRPQDDRAAPLPEAEESAVDGIADAAGEEEKGDQFTGLHAVYDAVARRLALTDQADGIDYFADNFVHADFTLEEFTARQAERNETLLSFALQTRPQGRDAQPNPLKLFSALITGNPDLVKLAVIRTLGSGDDQIAALTGENVIITDRNLRCLEVLDREIAAGRRHIGIFYGAAHFPDMEQRLLAQGFARTRTEWLTAWDIRRPIRKAAPSSR